MIAVTLPLLFSAAGCLKLKKQGTPPPQTEKYMKMEDVPEGVLPVNRITEPVATFVLDGKAYCFSGSNNYYLTFASQAMVDDVLDRAVDLNMSVFRTWAYIDIGSKDGSVPPVDDALEEKGTKNGIYFQYWDKEEGKVKVNDGLDGLQKLDYVLHACRERGLKVIMVLTNNWHEMGGMDQYVVWYGAKHHHEFFTNEKIRARFKEWIDVLVNRVNSIDGMVYKDDPAIFAWELGNELRCRNMEEFDAAEGWDETTMVKWADEMATYLKSQDPNHMVGFGDEGFLNDTDSHWTHKPVDGVDHKALSEVDAIDFATFHLYPDNWGTGVKFGSEWVRDHLAVAREIGKPTLLEEYNTKVKRDKDLNITWGWERRKDALDNWHNIMREEGGNGTLVWMVAGIDDVHGIYPDYDGYNFWKGHPTGDLMKAHGERFTKEAAACALAGDLVKDVPKSPFVSAVHIEK